MKLDKKNIERFFRNKPQVVAAYLYGSRVTGYSSNNSDLDIAVVVNDTSGIDYGKFSFQVNQMFPDFETDLRIITKGTSPTFIFQVIRNNQCIYQKSDKEKVQFESKALRDFYDAAHLRDIYDSYLKSFFAGGQ